jgi:hypothetical protein
MQTAVCQIENKVKNYRRGKIFFIDDFATLGMPDAVKKIVATLGAVRLVGATCQRHLLVSEKRKRIVRRKDFGETILLTRLPAPLPSATKRVLCRQDYTP